MLSVQLGSRSNSPGPIGRVFFSLFFLAFFAAGIAFFSLIGRDVLQRFATYRWPTVPCLINSSRVITDDRSENPYRLVIEYEYDVDGRHYSSTRTKLTDIRSGNYGDLLRLATKYPPDSHATCYVNARNPQEAILQRNTLWYVFALAFPLPFMLIGAVGIVAVWKKSATSSSKPLSSVQPSAAGCTILFFSVFLLVGLGATTGLFIRPLWLIVQARSWQSVPCNIVASNVRSHRGDKGTTYSVDILYRYQVQGQEFRANRYAFAGGSSSGYQGKADLVAQYRPGSLRVCFVNPNDPTDAVLNRGMTAGLWVGLIPMVFAVVGALGIIFSLRKARALRVSVPGIETARVVGSPFDSSADDAHSPTLLKPRSSPRAKFAGAVLIALFWNGVTSVFVGHLISQWRHGHHELFLTIFMIPFVLIGTGMIAYAVYSFVGMFSPRIQLTCSARSALPGEALQLAWKIAGNLANVRSLRIYLEGREEATYRRGTNSTTDHQVFATVPVKDLNDAAAAASGSAELSIPADAIHSFNSANNKLIWAIWVLADIARMPNVKDEYPITILPQAVAPPRKR